MNDDHTTNKDDATATMVQPTLHDSTARFDARVYVR
jgi:hypothetical protein